MTEHRWYCHTGSIVTLTDDKPATMYNGINHEICVWEVGTLGQMLAKCGLRACPYPHLREVPGRGPVDCPECLEAAAVSELKPVV